MDKKTRVAAPTSRNATTSAWVRTSTRARGGVRWAASGAGINGPALNLTSFVNSRASSRPRVSRLVCGRRHCARRATLRLNTGAATWLYMESTERTRGRLENGTAGHHATRAFGDSSPRKTRRDSSLVSTRNRRRARRVRIRGHRTGRARVRARTAKRLVKRSGLKRDVCDHEDAHVRSPVSQRASLLLVPQVPRLSSLNRM